MQKACFLFGRESWEIISNNPENIIGCFQLYFKPNKNKELDISILTTSPSIMAPARLEPAIP
jgi:hypothetical protein